MRSVFAGVFLVAVALHAQTDTRERMEKAIERQRKALAGMAESIATQRRSVARQPSREPSRGFEATPAGNPGCAALPSGRIDRLVDDAARNTSVAPQLIRAVMLQESAFRPCALSGKGAMGLMQLEPETAQDMGVGDPFDPAANVLGGARLLKLLLDRYGGDLSLTLGAYNAGTSKVDAAMGVPLIPETIDYVNRILTRLSEEKDVQSPRDSAPSISLRLTGSDGGE